MAQRLNAEVLPSQPDSHVEVLRESLTQTFPDLLRVVGDELATMWPTYTAYMEEHRDQLALASEVVIPQLLATVSDPAGRPGHSDTLDPAIANVFEQIGRVHYLHGQDLTSLLTAYQSGARVSWEFISQAAIAAGIGPTDIARLAQTLFTIVHDLSACTSQGFVSEQSDSGMAAQRARAELTGQIMSPFTDLIALRRAADRALWRLPDEVVFVILRLDKDETPLQSVQTDPEWLFVRVDGVVGLIAPWARGTRERLIRALASEGAMVGPPMPMDQARTSLTLARSALSLQRSGLITESVAFVGDHLDTLIVHQRPQRVAALRSQVLAPLDDLPQATRERLIETLTSWLRHMGSRVEIAEELHIHPQTVRYRVEQLREAFGPALDSPAERARLYLALIWGEPVLDAD